MRSAGLVVLSFALLTQPSGAATQGGARTAATTIIDLVVTGPDGGPVTGLRPADLVIRLDGRPQTVMDVRPSPAAGASRQTGLPAPYATNTSAQGRAIAVLVDVSRLAPNRTAAVEAGLETLTATLAPVDRLALIPLSTEQRPVDFTTAHARVAEAARQITTYDGAPRTARQDETAVETTLAAVARAATLLGDEPGVTPLVLVTEPFAATTRLRRTIQSLAGTLARHRIALYIVTPGSRDVPSTNGVHALAAGTGGFVVAGEAWDAITMQERARVEVRLAPDLRLDAGATVRALAAPARAGLTVRGAPVAPIPDAASDALQPLADMLRQSRPFTDLPLRLAAYPILHSDRSSIRLLVLGETVDAARPLAWSEFALIAPDGRVTAQWTEERDAIAQRPLVSGVLAPEGAFRLRWAASELSGRRGTVDLELDTRLTTAGPFRMSALMLGQLEQDVFVPALQAPPDAAALEWYAEIYGEGVPGQALDARYEVLSSPGTPPIAAGAGRVLTSPDPGRRAMTGQVALDTLGAGDYLLRATLVIDGTDAGTVERTFRRMR